MNSDPCYAARATRVQELITMVNVAARNERVDVCRSGDGNGDGHITVDDIVTAVE